MASDIEPTLFANLNTLLPVRCTWWDAVERRPIACSDCDPLSRGHSAQSALSFWIPGSQKEVSPSMFRNGSSIVVGLLVKNIRRFLAGEPLDASTTAMPTASSRPAFQNAMLLDFNYDVEPLPGHFPGPRGPASFEGDPSQPPGQAHVRVVLLAQPLARKRHPWRAQSHAPCRQGSGHRDQREGDSVMTTDVNGWK